jgi:DNA-binding response OmpR family regulator
MSKILVAEDDKFLASAYKVKLKKAGYEVKIVFDGNELLQSMNTFKPDLIILDLVMPVLDGFAVLEKLRASTRWKSIPILVASNLGQSEDIVRATKLGANDYILKTELSMKKLLAKVSSFLQKNQPVKQV